MTEIQLNWHDHKYFPYEKELAKREIEALIKPNKLTVEEDKVIFNGEIKSANLNRLVYFASYSSQGETKETLQRRLESSCTKTGHQRRQSTRYSVHGIHEYKGKFNPQIVRGILNVLDIPSGSNLIDPFCGSGTTLVESTHAEINAIGTDLNPLAILISNAKLLALSSKSENIKKYFNKIINHFNANNFIEKEDEYSTYLKNWFPENYYSLIERLRISIIEEGGKYKNIFFTITSNLLRDYSLQEPSDLRIRRRKSPFPNTPFIEALIKATDNFLDNLDSSQNIVGKLEQKGQAYSGDSRSISKNTNNWKLKPSFDVAITSPPYATALPYIDTQRLSLIWLRLLTKGQVRELEAHLTGSREIIGTKKKILIAQFKNNECGLSPVAYKFCKDLQASLGEDDGFRRQAVPNLMYRYFVDMQLMFREVKSIMKDNAPFALVVGHNKTTLGGKPFDINTPLLLKEIAVYEGWTHDESITLQTYQRFGIHKKNAVKHETLLILRNNE